MEISIVIQQMTRNPGSIPGYKIEIEIMEQVMSIDDEIFNGILTLCTLLKKRLGVEKNITTIQIIPIGTVKIIYSIPARPSTPSA